MSIFASRVTKTIPIPFDPPHTVTIQRLAGRHLERAKTESLFASADYLKRMGGASFQQELSSLGNPAEVAAAVEKARADPLQKYDRLTVLEKGIKAWTYDDPPSRAALEDLTEEASDLIARAILRLTFPDAFDAEAKKND